jgi:rod shape determining protein RodA
MYRILRDRLDWGLIAASLVLIVIGLIAIASGDKELFARQLIWVFAALALIFGLAFLNLRAALSYRWVILAIYLVLLTLLIATYFLAPAIHGAKSWILVGPLRAQPSEFMKIALVVLLSSFFAVRHVAIAQIGVIIASFVYFLIPAIFVILQPDLGTALILFSIWFSYLIFSGLPIRYIVGVLLLFAILGVGAWEFGLADYQKARILALFQPETDPLGVNYSVAQSKIAIGSGGIFGKGFGQGTQVQLGFLPAAQTDFVFAAFTEEWGLMGGTVLIGAFLFLIYRIVRLGLSAESNFPRFICLGTAAILLSHLVVNLGSSLGILPVIGVGLPFVSYGGSNLLTVSALLGIIQSVSLGRKT